MYLSSGVRRQVGEVIDLSSADAGRLEHRGYVASLSGDGWRQLEELRTEAARACRRIEELEERLAAQADDEAERAAQRDLGEAIRQLGQDLDAALAQIADLKTEAAAAAGETEKKKKKT